MKFRRVYRGVLSIAAAVLISTAMVATGTALESSNYRFDESTLGAGGQIQSNSANFQSANSAGDIGVGDSASSNYQVIAGSQTTNDPVLSFSVDSADANLGSFSAGTTATATATFSISNYTSYGYVVQITGTPPSNGNYSLPAMTTPGSAVAGTEQFGINLTANTTPTSFGANPIQTIFGEGVTAPNYSIPNTFRYVTGETIASAPKSSGKTTYTLSYMVNVNSLTPGGKYTSNQTVIVTGTY